MSSLKGASPVAAGPSPSAGEQQSQSPQGLYSQQSDLIPADDATVSTSLPTAIVRKRLEVRPIQSDTSQQEDDADSLGDNM